MFASYLYTHITHVWPGHLSTDCYAPNCVHLCAFLFAGAAAAAARSFLSIYASCLCAPTRPSPTATPHRTPQLVGAAAKPSRKPIQRAYFVNSPPTLIILLFIRLCDNIMRTRAQIRFYLCTHSRTVKTLSLFRHLVHLRLTLQPPPPPGGPNRTHDFQMYTGRGTCNEHVWRKHWTMMMTRRRRREPHCGRCQWCRATSRL